MLTVANFNERVCLVGVDDHPIVVNGLYALIKEAAPEFEWAGTARSYQEMVRLFGRADFAERTEGQRLLVLYDLNLADGSDPYKAIAKLVQRGINVAVLTSEYRPVPLRNAVEAGAVGLALKSDPLESIVDVLRAASRGEEAVSTEVAFALVTERAFVPNLTERELEVLRLLAGGLPRKAVGSKLDPPVKLATVATYLNRVFVKYQKLDRDVMTFPDAIREATRDGFLMEPGRLVESGPLARRTRVGR